MYLALTLIRAYLWSIPGCAVSATPPSTVTAAAAAAAVVWSCDACISDTTIQQQRIGLRSRSHSLSLSPPPPYAFLSVWRTARGPRYYQIWEMVLLAAVTAGCLPVQRLTVCPTNHRVSIHGALSSARLQPLLALADISLHWLGILVRLLTQLWQRQRIGLLWLCMCTIWC